MAQSQTTFGTNQIQILELQGRVEVSAEQNPAWKLAQINQSLHSFDRVRTGVNSRLALRWSDQSVVPFGASTELEILPPQSADDQCGLHLIRGIISFFHRDKPGRIQIITRGAVAGVEGTEFVLAVNDVDATKLSVVDGKVKFGNERAMLVLTNGEQAVAELGKPPARTDGFIANNLLQWCFYYPAVLDLNDLPLSADEQKVLAGSLQAYRAGDLTAALAKFPSGKMGSDAERIYYAALLLSAGQVEPAENSLVEVTARNSGHFQRLAAALRELISAVKREPDSGISNPQLATEFLAGSYYEQSRARGDISLKKALSLAKQAATNSPNFGFAWERVAEVEFSFGHTQEALAALNKSLAFAPRGAQALALKGFLLAAQNKTREAIVSFNDALAVDSALGNAWLGRGLCRIRCGDAKGGREDLLVAAALEPQRAELRSYLGKAFANTGDYAHAGKELQLAKKSDPNDPTAWLYSALIDQENNQINDAIRDLEKSQALNDNRSVYRSQFLLDQDQAVRSANLAAMYRDAGMFDVSTREAARAVNYDYANYSAHLFLADSYQDLRDPNEINLRYETPAKSEFLIANLLAPASAGSFSPVISQQEYSRLFEGNRYGVVSDTEYASRGAWTQSGAQFGTLDNFSYDVEAFYRSDPGERINEDIEQRQLTLGIKQQFTPQDSVYFTAQQYQAASGDLDQYYNPDMASPTFRLQEKQEPIVAAGYHHEWSPGVHTLAFVTRIDDAVSFTNFTQPSLFAVRPEINGVPTLTAVDAITMGENYVEKLEIYSGELQQIWEGPVHNTIIGARIQYGHFDTSVLQDNPNPVASAFLDLPPPQDINSMFKRISFYGYHQWQIFEPLQLIGGLTYDHLDFPENFRLAPISRQETTRDKFSPKAGLIWTPADKTTVRFAYTRSLSGASLDQSYQLEPSQVAGFVQSYRSIIPESVAGGNAGAEFETYDISLEQKFRSGTYLGISGEILNSSVNRLDGAFDYFPTAMTDPVPSGLRENLDYQEKSFQFTANQLLGRGWSLGARYQVSEAVLNDNFPDVPANLSPTGASIRSKQRTEAILHQLSLSAIYNHPSGFFAEQEVFFLAQNSQGFIDEPGDDFWQLNSFIGYRAFHRKAEISLGLLNATDQDYQLNPLNVHEELPHRRTLIVRFQLNF